MICAVGKKIHVYKLQDTIPIANFKISAEVGKLCLLPTDPLIVLMTYDTRIIIFNYVTGEVITKTKKIDMGTDLCVVGRNMIVATTLSEVLFLDSNLVTRYKIFTNIGETYFAITKRAGTLIIGDQKGRVSLFSICMSIGEMLLKNKNYLDVTVHYE
jgi:hypothetical protein